MKFYPETAGLKLHEEFGWAELQGPNRGAIGIAQENGNDPIKAGNNTYLTFTVENLEKYGNHFQLAEVLGN